MLQADPQIIGIKQLHIQLKHIPERVAQGEEFIVVKNSKPVFKIVPFRTHVGQKKLDRNESLDFLKRIRFKSKDPKLSERIDSILYQ